MLTDNRKLKIENRSASPVQFACSDICSARSFSCLLACLPARFIRSFVRYALLGRVSEPFAFQRCFNKLEYTNGIPLCPRRFNCLNRIGEYKNFILDLSSILSLSLDDNYQLLSSFPSLSAFYTIQTPSYLSAAAAATAWPILRLHRNREKARFC